MGIAAIKKKKKRGINDLPRVANLGLREAFETRFLSMNVQESLPLKKDADRKAVHLLSCTMHIIK